MAENFRKNYAINKTKARTPKSDRLKKGKLEKEQVSEPDFTLLTRATTSKENSWKSLIGEFRVKKGDQANNKTLQLHD